MLEIGPFSRREAMSYLVGRLSDHPDQRRGVIDLVDDLDCQPLALAQATAVIASSWMTSVDYREQFRRRSAALGSPGAEPLPAASVTWTLSLETADQLMPGGSAEPCLALAAMLDGHGIPATVFAGAACSYVAGGVAAPGALERVQETLAVLDEVVLISLDRRSEPPIVRMNQALGQADRAGLPAGSGTRRRGPLLRRYWNRGPRRSPTRHLLRACGPAQWPCPRHRRAAACRGQPPTVVRAGRVWPRHRSLVLRSTTGLSSLRSRMGYSDRGIRVDREYRSACRCVRRSRTAERGRCLLPAGGGRLRGGARALSLRNPDCQSAAWQSSGEGAAVGGSERGPQRGNGGLGPGIWAGSSSAR